MARSTSKTTVIDRGERALLRRLSIAHNATVSIGVHNDTGRYTKNKIDVVDVAFFHEFGTDTIPKRSFLSDSMVAFLPKIMRKIKRERNSLIFDGTSAFVALSRVGVSVTNMIRGRIRQNAPPFTPLSEATIKAKGKSTPLLDTGLLMRSINHKVVMGGRGGAFGPAF